MVDLTRFASITQTRRDESRTTAKYRFVSTMEVVNVLRSRGWFPVAASQARTKDRNGYQKHLIRFRQEQDGNLNGAAPEIVVVGSHAGLSASKIFAGLIEFACVNGLIVASEMFASHSIRHVGYADTKVHAALDDIMQNVPKIMETRDAWQSISLTREQCREFACFAYGLRHDTEKEPMTENVMRQLLNCRHSAQSSDSLWNVYNRIQENLMAGFYRHGENHRKAKNVRAIDANVKINSALWLHAEQVAASEDAWTKFDRLVVR